MGSANEGRNPPKRREGMPESKRGKRRKDILGETRGVVEEKRLRKTPSRSSSNKKAAGRGVAPRTLQVPRALLAGLERVRCVTAPIPIAGGRKGGGVFGARLARGKASERLWAGIQQINKTSKTA